MFPPDSLDDRCPRFFYRVEEPVERSAVGGSVRQDNVLYTNFVKNRRRTPDMILMRMGEYGVVKS